MSGAQSTPRSGESRGVRSDHEIAEADAARPAYHGEADDGSEDTSWWRWSLTSLLAFLVVVMVVVLARQVHAQDDRSAIPDGNTPLVAGATVESAETKAAALEFAADATETVLTYRAASLEEDIAAAEGLIAGGMTVQYDATMDRLREQTLARQRTVEATVVAASAISVTADEARVLLFVDQQTSGPDLDSPTSELNRVVVTVQRDRDESEGDWKITALDAV